MIGSWVYKRTIAYVDILRKPNMKIFSAATLIGLFFVSGAVAKVPVSGTGSGGSNSVKKPTDPFMDKVNQLLSVCNKGTDYKINCKACFEGLKLYKTRNVCTGKVWKSDSTIDICSRFYNSSCGKYPRK